LSLRRTMAALPELLRIGAVEAIAYRAEMFIWMLATTMPLVMLALWTSVARGAPVGRYGERQFVAYFLATFIVRQLTGSWAFYQMNMEVRDGTLAMRLLRPVHPLWGYAAEGIASMPLRFLISLPVAIAAVVFVSSDSVTHDGALWAAWAVAVLLAWMITLLVNLLVGCTAFFTESSFKLMDVWLVFYFVFSGYLIPIDLFPPRLQAVVEWLPFRYQIGVPVELMTGAHSRGEACRLLVGEGAWVAVLAGATAVLWRRGVREFAAYGG
jgi:ABC-2 type transport system permease protein